jgi:hypothetical protein
VNWLARSQPFDFDQVEIGQVSDEEVERFAVQVGNDTDPWRRARYQEIGCILLPESNLSENTLRILRSRFGEVSKLR